MTSLDSETAKVIRLADLGAQLHKHCLEKPQNTIFTQHDLLALSIIPNGSLNTLLECVNSLMRDCLFKVVNYDGQNGWKALTREDAAK
jgi:hypothetical protein